MVFHQRNSNPTKIDGIIVQKCYGLYGGIIVLNGGIIVFIKVSLFVWCYHCMKVSLIIWRYHFLYGGNNRTIIVCMKIPQVLT